MKIFPTSATVLIPIVLMASSGAQGADALDLKAVQEAVGRAIGEDGRPSPAVKLERKWSGDLCRSELINTGGQSVRIKEIVLFAIHHTLPTETPLYGEGFQMLSQTGGTLGHPTDLGEYTDRKHYRMPQPADSTVIYGMLTLSPPKGDRVLMGFASCRRFAGRFHVRPKTLEVVLDAEGLELAPGQRWELEEFLFAAGPDRNDLLARLADRIRQNHPPRKPRPEPTGWCSWYCFGPRVTAREILDNLGAISKDIPALRTIQVDDGYQPAMGDWLDAGTSFAGGVRDVLAQIRGKGYEPAIWVAPFIAEEKSRLFREHPDWFIKDDAGRPLPSNKVTFGGWRRGPWYALDGTHPEVQEHLERLFLTMRRGLGCTYFKLDANFWGAMHGGRLHDPKATRVEAYRRGMEAILRGAGEGFVLGCNHPIWPSLGLIDGSRSSGDIARNWSTVAQTARENLSRNWQNGRLWWNDPDCVVLTGRLGEEEFKFHATAIFASGGMVLSGDDLTKLPAAKLDMLKKLVPPTGVAASFEDESLRVGRVPFKGREMVCVFNWKDTPQAVPVKLLRAYWVRDFWTDEDLGRHEGEMHLGKLPARSARLLVCTPE